MGKIVEGENGRRVKVITAFSRASRSLRLLAEQTHSATANETPPPPFGAAARKHTVKYCGLLELPETIVEEIK